MRGRERCVAVILPRSTLKTHARLAPEVVRPVDHQVVHAGVHEPEGVLADGVAVEAVVAADDGDRLRDVHPALPVEVQRGEPGLCATQVGASGQETRKTT